MTRLVAFGCSLTQGAGLPDVYGTAKPHAASQYAWPALLGKALGLPVVNNGKPGISNRRIWHEMMYFDYQPGDIVYTLWTFPERYCRIEKKREGKFRYEDFAKFLCKYPEHKKHDAAVTYYEHFQTDYASDMETGLYFYHIRDFLHRKEIEFYCNIVYPLGYASERDQSVFGDARLESNNILEQALEIDLAADDMHPGLGGQKRMMQLMRELK